MSIEKTTLLNNRYRLGVEIGSGGFGVVKRAYDERLKKNVAIKIERIHGHSTLCHERDVYRSVEGKLGFPTIYDYFQVGSSCYMSMTLLGDSLETKLRQCENHMNLQTTLLIADQLIDRIKELHSNCYVHRDIKPENLIMGTGMNQKLLFMVDLGIAKVFKMNNYHVSWTEHDYVIGTKRFASINNHEGGALSRRDDIESMMYVLIYLQKGSLPWQGVEISDTEEKSNVIYKIKCETKPEKLCEGLEPEFVECLKYARSLDYAQKPDYKKLKQLFRNLYDRKRFERNYCYQWDMVKNKSKKKQMVKEKDKPKVEEKDKPKVEEKDKPKVEEKDKPKVEEKDKPKVEEKDKPKAEEKVKPKTFKETQAEFTALATLHAEQEKKMKTKSQAELTALAAQQAEYEKIMKLQFFNRPLLI
ncbi:kinase-like domain-containing protein [Pilaira anomala]|nr:kinase-like domain-containing protein [Pilaira anomala]